MRHLTVPAIVALAAIVWGCSDSSSRNAANQVQEGLQAIEETQEPAVPPADERTPDPIMEDQCANVTQRQMDAVEDKMKDLTGETVMLVGDEMTHLGCSRYRQYLRGEIDSY